MPSSGLNLSAVDKAFGEKADLYRDVFNIRSDATNIEIQEAYFRRRNEFLQILAKMDQSGVPPDYPRRYHIKSQIDALVMALRVLGDDDARIMYNFLRSDRIAGRIVSSPRASTDEDDVPLGIGTSVSVSYSDTSYGIHSRRLKSALKTGRSSDDGQRSPAGASDVSMSISKSRSVDYYDRASSDLQENIRKLTPHDDMSRVPRAPRASKLSPKNTPSRGSVKNSVSNTSVKRKTRKVTPPRDEMVRARTSRRLDDDDASQGSVSSATTQMESSKSIFDRVKEELRGVVEDTTRSFEQVFNAFTLQDEEIKAVFGRIDKAKKQMQNKLSH